MDVKETLSGPFDASLTVTTSVCTPTTTIVNVSDDNNDENKQNQEDDKLDLEATISSDSTGDSIRDSRRYLMLGLLCSAQFFDIFNAASVIIALPEIAQDIHFTSGALQWVLSAYTLTFAASFLFAGRLTDIYHPKPVFCFGYLMVGLLSVLCGVSVNAVMLLIFRGLQGIGAALTFPSALSMIVRCYPDPIEQSRALAIFGGFGAIGNVVGFVLGGVITAQLNWRWIFYLVAMIVAPFSALSFYILPKHVMNDNHRQRKLDWQGVVALAGGLVLFVYGLTDGNNAGWAKPQIIVTLVFSVVFIVGFFFIERFVSDPAIPTSTWKIANFTPLFIYCWSLYWFVNGIEIQFIQIFQDIWQWSPLKAAIHCLPIGITAGICVSLAGRIVLIFPPKSQLVFGQVLMGVSSILFVFADTPDKYWTHILPGMIICMIGTAVAYVSVNVFIMASAPKGQEGVIGAMMNTAFQLGATVGLAIITAITFGFNQHQPTSSLRGYQASFWSLLVLDVVMITISLIFVR